MYVHPWARPYLGKLRILRLEVLLPPPGLPLGGLAGVPGVGQGGDGRPLHLLLAVVVVNVDGVEGGGRLPVAGHVVGERSLWVLHTLTGGRPVADPQTGVEYQVCWAALQAGLSVLTFVILPTVAGVPVQLITRPCRSLWSGPVGQHLHYLYDI